MVGTRHISCMRRWKKQRHGWKWNKFLSARLHAFAGTGVGGMASSEVGMSCVAAVIAMLTVSWMAVFLCRKKRSPEEPAAGTPREPPIALLIYIHE